MLACQLEITLGLRQQVRQVLQQTYRFGVADLAVEDHAIVLFAGGVLHLVLSVAAAGPMTRDLAGRLHRADCLREMPTRRFARVKAVESPEQCRSGATGLLHPIAVHEEPQQDQLAEGGHTRRELGK
jgi:hypothetical protein